ncbi:radical SAM-associated putative lipoprotein [Paludibacteraceae bacterium OttesenSCG-928-F17]|nr:radical SAM-associated putative lipoprotein [Paludibacteraceae bacterium OttesenSCG-928-F17]
MKNYFIKLFDKTMIAVLGLIGLASACNPIAEYGVPHADFEIKGTIIDKENNSAISNIRIIRQTTREDTENYGYPDTTYTNDAGNFSFKFSEFSSNSADFSLTIEDIDGIENGGEFEEKTIEASFTKSDQVRKKDGWYEGGFLKKYTIELEQKETQE